MKDPIYAESLELSLNRKDILKLYDSDQKLQSKFVSNIEELIKYAISISYHQNSTTNNSASLPKTNNQIGSPTNECSQDFLEILRLRNARDIIVSKYNPVCKMFNSASKYVEMIMPIFINNINQHTSMSVISLFECYENIEGSINRIVESNPNLLSILLSNLQYDGIISIMRLIMDYTDKLILPNENVIALFVRNIKNIHSYDLACSWTALFRSIIGRGCFHGESYNPPIRQFYLYLLTNSVMKQFIDLLIDKNPYISLVILSLIHKIYEPKLDSDTGVYFDDRPLYNIPFIARSERLSYDISSIHRTSIYRDFNRTFKKFLSLYKSIFLDSYTRNNNHVTHLCFPYLFKYIYMILNNLLQFNDYDFYGPRILYEIFISYYPLFLTRQYPILAQYCLDIIKSLYKIDSIMTGAISEKSTILLYSSLSADFDIYMRNRNYLWAYLIKINFYKDIITFFLSNSILPLQSTPISADQFAQYIIQLVSGDFKCEIGRFLYALSISNKVIIRRSRNSVKLIHDIKSRCSW